MIVNLPNRAYLADIERFLRLVDDDGDPSFTLVTREGLFSLHPIVLCMIAALGDYAFRTGGEVQVDIRERNQSVRYLQRMKMFDVMELPTNISMVEHEAAGRFIPVTRVKDNSSLNKFVLDFVPLLHASQDEADSVKYVLFELVRNVLEHSGSPDGALAAAQVTRSGRLLVAVADSGIGVLRSLQRSHPVSDHRSAIALAFEPGVTGATSRYGGNETNGGAGLFFMKAMATMAHHHMVMISGGTLMKLLTQPAGIQAVIHSKLADDRVKWWDLPFAFPGTAVGIDITVQESVGFSRLLREIREVYHVNVKKRKKQRYRPVFN